MKQVLVTLLLTAVPAIAQAAPLTLVQDGKPNATIVVQADAPKPVQTAGADLQKYIQKISGVELPLKTDGKEVPGITLNVGKTESSVAGDLPDAKLNPETYAIRRRGDDLYFAGNYPSPTAFAVYSFLQDQLGVRWFAPGEDWEYAPQKTSGTLRIEPRSVVVTPDYSPRIWSAHQWAPDWGAWNLRNKTVQSERVPRREFQNNMFRVFPPSKYGKTHPEYYPLVNGKRWIPTSDTDRYWWPCIGNPEVQRITVEYMRDYFTKNPQADSFSLGMDDIVHMCSDPLCRALDANPDDYEKHKFSNRFYTFINIVAKELKKTHPDKYIGTLVYSIARELPPKVPQMEDNVFGYITQTSAQWYNPEIKKADQELTRAWAKRMKHLSRYDYFGFASFTPRVFPHLLDEAMKFDHALGFEGMYFEMYAFVPHAAPSIWAFAQLQWDTEQSVDVLLNDFYSKMFPSTTADMKRYFDLLEKSWMTSRPGHTGPGWEHRNILKQATSISAQDTRTGLALLDKAWAAAKTPVEKRRIDVIRGGLQYASYAILPYDLAQQLATLNVANESDAKRGVALATEFAALLKARETDWPQAHTRQDLLGENLRGLKGMILSNGESYLQSDTAQLDNAATPGLLKIMDWYQKNQPAQAEQITRDMTAAFANSAFADTISGWIWVTKNKPASLLKNGDFESAANAPNATAAQADWDVKGAPSGWNTWSSLGSGTFGSVPGYNTGKGVRVTAPPEGLGENAVVLQNVPVKAGKKYLAVVWVKANSKASAPQASLTLRLRTKDGWYEAKNNSTSTNASSSAEWQPLMLTMQVPTGASVIAMLLGMKDGEAHFDNAALYELP